MPQQDLTPQLRTRLSRVERAVGLFVTFATLLLVAGFVYYIYHVAQRKGWFTKKITYTTSLNNAAGIAIGQPVKLMGFDVGSIMEVIPNEPSESYGVTVVFQVLAPNFGYIWTDTRVRVAAADFLGHRNLEIVKGYDGAPTILERTNLPLRVLDRDLFAQLVTNTFAQKFAATVQKLEKQNLGYNEHAIRAEASNVVDLIVTNEAKQILKADPEKYYRLITKNMTNYWIEPLESPAVTERLETVVDGLEKALPNILDLTNKIAAILTNANNTVSEVRTVLTNAHPVVTNLAMITENLRDPHGSLGEWLLPTNLNVQLQTTLSSVDTTMKKANTTLTTANTTLHDTDTNLYTLVSNLNRSLDNLADITSNLNVQVQQNSNILSEISTTVVNSDNLVQGLKRHWLLRSAFKTNKVDKSKEPVQAPKKR